MVGVDAGEVGTDDVTVEIVGEAGFAVEGEDGERTPAEVEVGAKPPVVVGGEGEAVENIVLVGVEAGVVAGGVEVGKAELSFELLVAGGVHEILVEEETFFGDSVFAETGKGATGAEFHCGGKGVSGLQAEFLFQAGNGGVDSLDFQVFRFAFVLEVEKVLAPGAGPGELGHDFLAVAGTSGTVTGREVVEPVVVGHEVEIGGDAAFDASV